MVNYNPILPDFAGTFKAIEDYKKSQSPEAQMERDRVRVLKEIGQQYQGGMPDPKALGAALLSIGDVKGAMTAAQLARSQADDDWQRQYQQQSLDIQRQNANRVNVIGNADTGYIAIDRQGRPVGTTPGGAAGGAPGLILPPRSKPVSASDEKVGREAESSLPGMDASIRTLEEAQKLTSEGYSGTGAGARTWIGKNLPDWMVPDAIADPKTALATERWLSRMKPEAITAMASTLKGPSTNFELQQFQEAMADPNASLQVKKEKLDALLTKAREERAVVARRAEEYKTRRAGRSEGTAPVTTAPPGPDARTMPQYEEGKRYRSKSTGKVFVIRNGVPVEEPQ